MTADDRPWSYRASGIYLMPYDVMVSATWMLQSGPPETTTVLVTAQTIALAQGSQTVQTTRTGDVRLPNQGTIDLNIAKSFELSRHGETVAAAGDLQLDQPQHANRVGLTAWDEVSDSDHAAALAPHQVRTRRHLLTGPMTMSRPNITRTIGLLLALCGIGFVLLRSNPVIAQSSARQAPIFEVDPFWPKPLPNHWVTGSTIGLSVDAQDRVWTIHRPNTVEDNFKAADIKVGDERGKDDEALPGSLARRPRPIRSSASAARSRRRCWSTTRLETS